MKRLLLLSSALASLTAPALAQTRALPPGEIHANGDITFGNALNLGKREGNKTAITPDTLQIFGTGSTGEASTFSVSPSASAPNGSLGKFLAVPTFSRGAVRENRQNSSTASDAGFVY